MLFAILAFNAFLTSCSDEEPFSTATPNDEPRILDPTFPDRVNGNLATFANFSRDGKFSMKLTVTPADYTTVTWFVDGEEVATGTEIEKEFMAGTYHLKITATTTVGKSTYREGLIQVNIGSYPVIRGCINIRRMESLSGTSVRGVVALDNSTISSR